MPKKFFAPTQYNQKLSFFIPPLQLAIFVLAGVLLPILVPNINFSILISLLLFIGWATSWDILGGWTGQTSLGHAAFVGIGAYSMAVLTQKHDFDAISAMQLGMLLAGILALVWGSLTFKLKGSYFTLSTIAIAEILRLVAINERWLTGGGEGIFIFSLSEPFGLDLFDRQIQYYIALVYAALLIGLVMWFAHNRFGYQMQAVRENEESAQAAGINPNGIKMQAFILSSALTASGGAIYALFLSSLEPHDIFFLPLSIQIALTAIIGGRGTIWGPALGATLLILSAEFFRNIFAEANLLIYGVLILVVILFMPRGIVGELESWLIRKNYAKDKQEEIV